MTVPMLRSEAPVSILFVPGFLFGFIVHSLCMLSGLVCR